ncbi:MAG: cytidylate kinase-like family protein [Anaerolineae bacterium]|nr:cytidylate kinase-like family protein [Anaerolineae bacterium]
MAVITISRQYGSGGDDIARRVCEILGYRYFDKKLMAQVALEVELCEEEIVDFSEENYKVRGFFQRLFGPRGVVEMESREPGTEGVGSVAQLDEAKCIHMVQETVKAAYEQGNVVIMGRGAQAILKDMPGVLHVRVEATLGARVMRVHQQQSITIARAEESTRISDQASAAYLKKFYDINWDSPLHYHLVINTGKWGVEASAQIIVNALSHLRMGLGI